MRGEHLRLASLYAHLFRQHSPQAAAKEPEISLESFIWAHCLVRSRALELTAEQVAGSVTLIDAQMLQQERIQKPGIHKGSFAVCDLAWLQGSGSRLLAQASIAQPPLGCRVSVGIAGLTARPDVVRRRPGQHSMSAACCRSSTYAIMMEYMLPAASLCASHQQECQGAPPACALYTSTP